MRKFFYPESIVVIGVSVSRVNLGRIIMQNNIDRGFKGRIYGVGREAGEVGGRRVYNRIADIPETPDAAIIITPAETVPGLVRECAAKGIDRIVIESGGFSEYSPEARGLENEIREIARVAGMRIIGPNCIGVINNENNLMMPFAYFKDAVKTGSVSIIAQSGGVGDSYIRITNENHVFFNKFATTGNKLDVDEVDYFKYFLEDPGTESILMYLEGFSRGRDFFNLALSSKKPIVVQKSNRTPLSAGIALSHTAALSADDDVVSAALHQAGVIRVKGEDELLIAAKALKLPPLKDSRIAVLSRSGGHAVITADACCKFGFELVKFPDSFIEKIKTFYVSRVISHQNPLDLGEIFDYTIFIKILEAALMLEEVDGVIFNHLYQSAYESETSRIFLDGVKELVEKHGKPVAVTLISDAEEILDISRNHPYPTFSTPLQSANALRGALYYHRRLEARENRGRPAEFEIDSGAIEAVREKCRRENRIPLTHEALQIASASGITPVPGLVISGEANELPANFRYPAALKLLSPDASHKTEAGGVMLGISGPAELADAVRRMKAGAASLNPPVSVKGFLLQEMSPPGTEFFAGGRRDPVFGPVVTAGCGGVFVEILRDRAIRLAPVSENEVYEMLSELRSYPLLKGARGRAPLDIKSFAEIICRISWLMHACPCISEIDLNPLIVLEEGRGTGVVDSRVFFKE